MKGILYQDNGIKLVKGTFAGDPNYSGDDTYWVDSKGVVHFDDKGSGTRTSGNKSTGGSGNSGNNSNGSGGGCISGVIVLVILIAVIAFCLKSCSSSNGNSIASTTNSQVQNVANASTNTSDNNNNLEPVADEIAVDDDQSEEYIFPNSDSEYLERSDLTGLSAWELRVGRNEIYARLGRRFDDPELQNYFDNCDWYSGDIDPDDFDNDILNDYERTNAFFIRDYEKEMGYTN